MKGLELFASVVADLGTSKNFAVIKSDQERRRQGS